MGHAVAVPQGHRAGHDDEAAPGWVNVGGGWYKKPREKGNVAMATRTWLGSSGGDWFSSSLWTTATGSNSYPLAGDLAFINGGTVDLAGSEEIVTVAGSIAELQPVDGAQVTLGSADPSDPAAIVATSAIFGRRFTIVSTGTAGYAALNIVGPTGYAGAITANAAGGVFSIQATAADGAQPADFVLLNGGGISVTNGDDMVLSGSIVLESSVSIGAGSTLTNDATVRTFAGGTTLSSGATLTGDGTVVVGPDSTLYLQAAVPASQTIAFDGAGRINLGDVAGFAAPITDFTLGSTIDLLNTVANYASYDAANGVLTIENSGTTVANLTLQGPASSGTLSAVSDGSGGTAITMPGSGTRISYEIDTADQAMQANVVRATMTTPGGAPIDGSGIKIGIMSDSFNATLNGTIDPADIAAQQGYLPASGTVSAVTVLQDLSASGVENEGLAMAELVHQVAPGAQLYFYSAEGGQDSFANGVNALVNAGVNIIVDDWSFSATPFFQIAGTIDTAVQNAIAKGVNYFTAASNYDSAYFQAAWQPTTAQLLLQSGTQTVSAQTFDNGTNFQTITVPGSLATTIDLQWDAAWPARGGSVADQLGMALYNLSGTLVASSTQVIDSPDYIGIPEIALSVPQSSTTQQYQLAIYQIGTVAVSQFKYIMFGSPGAAQDPGGTIDDPKAGIGSGAVHGWELMPGVNTVGADYWANSPAFGGPSTATEWFSSTGPGQLLFDQSGNPIDQYVGKPDFVAPDGIETSVPGFQLFYGSSAAAPDAAAVAALMLQANPALTTQQVTSMLEQSALDMGLPAASQGAGLIQAPGAVQLALDAVACFAAGTRIDTGRGEVAVEALGAGDRLRVPLRDGAAAIVWIGQRQVDCVRHPRPRLVWPVRIGAGAFGAGTPRRDLFLSPDHAVYVNGVLIPVKHLINGATIAQVPVDAVTYYHVELARHEVLLAEGLAVESYLDVGDRANFSNGGGAVRLFADFSSRVWEAFGCAPLVVGGPELAAARRLVNAAAA